MRPESIIHILAMFSMSSGLIGFTIWNYNGFYFPILIGIDLALLGIIMDQIRI